MTETDILSRGVTLMLYGMGVVAVFLSLLVLTTQLMSALLAKYGPQATEQSAGQANPGRGQTGSTVEVNPQHIAAISAALHQHRQRK